MSQPKPTAMVAASDEVADQVTATLANARQGLSEVKVERFDPAVPPLPREVVLLVIDLVDLTAHQCDELLTRHDAVINVRPLWQFGSTCFARLPELTLAFTQRRSVSVKWSFCAPNADFPAWLRNELLRRIQARDYYSLRELLTSRSRVVIPARRPVAFTDRLLDEACRALDRWKDQTDPTQIESPLNRHLQSVKALLLADLGQVWEYIDKPAPVAEGSAQDGEGGLVRPVARGDVRAELRTALTAAALGVTGGRLPTVFFERFEAYMEIPSGLPNVRLRAAYLRALFLVVFDRLLAARLRVEPAALAQPRPLCRACRTDDGVAVAFDGPAPDWFAPRDLDGPPIAGFVLTEAGTTDRVASAQTEQSSVTFHLAPAPR